MAIKKSIDYDLQEVCNDLGINIADLKKLVKNPDSTNSKKNINSKISYSAEQVIQKFIANIRNGENLDFMSHNTTKYYLSFLNRFSKFLVRNYDNLSFIDLNEVIFHKFIAQINSENEKKLSLGSINTYTSILKKLCTFAYQHDYAPKNINYKFRKVPNETLPRYFSNEQLKWIFAEVDKKYNSQLLKGIFITLAGTGLRIDELVNLKIKDLDLKNKIITTRGKGNKERTIPLYPGVEKAILIYLGHTKVNDISYASGFIFSRTDGNDRQTSISVRSIQYHFKNIANQLNFDRRFTVHSFRHTFAVNCLKANMELAYLCQILGHESPSTTAIYTKLLPKDLQQIVEEKYPIPLEALIKQLLS